MVEFSAADRERFDKLCDAIENLAMEYIVEGGYDGSDPEAPWADLRLRALGQAGFLLRKAAGLDLGLYRDEAKLEEWAAKAEL